MNISKNKTKISTIALILTLTISATIVALPIVSAHDPPWEIATWVFLSAYPNPVGVGQPIFLVFWMDYYPPTAGGAYGDRYTFYVEVTKPDNSIQRLGPFTSDPVGGGFTSYTPDQVGTYTFVCDFPGHTYTGEPANPYQGIRRPEYIGDSRTPAKSEPDTVTVLADPVESPPPALFSDGPTEYWTRPVDASLRGWSNKAGNWLNDGTGFDYTAGPETAHILWTKPQTIGGLTGGPYGDIGYYEGSSYERKWRPAAIIQGRLYYRTGISDQPATRGTQCVDLLTGEEIFFMNRTYIDQGVIYDYQSPNQHGTIPYLLATGSAASIFDPTQTTPRYAFYDPWTGEWAWTIEDRPGGLTAVGEIGEPLRYVVDTGDNWMALWNATKPEELLGSQSGTGLWQWRPVGKTVDSTDAWEWNVTIPAELEGSARKVLADRIIGGDGYARFGGKVWDGEFTMWAISLAPGHEGDLIFNRQITAPPEGPPQNITMQFEGDIASLEHGVILMKAKETRSWYGFDINTGSLLWGPTESASQFMMYDRASTIYGDKFYYDGYDGVWCYDIKTGEHLWTFHTNKCVYEGPYEYWPVSALRFADGKIYITTGEHSHTQPLFRGWEGYCIDADTGDEIWSMTGVWNSPVLADGCMVTLNGMDNQIYCFGKGPTATTVSASPSVVPTGSSLMLQGMVTDESAGTKSDALMARFPNGVPAIADEDMTAWMDYVYRQFAMPMGAKGVEVVLETFDPNGNYNEIGRVTSDASGMFKMMWEPPVEGEYTIVASFAGSKAYWGSTAETAIGVAGEAAGAGAQGPPGPAGPQGEPGADADAGNLTLIAVGAIIVALIAIAVAVYGFMRKR
jgi:hypothetical protein